MPNPVPPPGDRKKLGWERRGLEGWREETQKSSPPSHHLAMGPAQAQGSEVGPLLLTYLAVPPLLPSSFLDPVPPQMYVMMLALV